MEFYRQQEMRENVERKHFEGCEGTIAFTLQINNLFDSLNRSFPKEGIRIGSLDLEVN